MKRKLTLIFLMVVSLSVLTACVDANETVEVNSNLTESGDSANELQEEVTTTDINTEALEEETNELKVEEMIADSNDAEQEEAEDENPSYTYTDMSATMYAKNTVNVRDLPDTVGNKIGSLSTNDEVQVTGQCNETDWYRITYKESTAYVSDAYLGTEKVEVTSPAETPSNGGESSNNGGGKVLVKIGDVPTPETEAWFYKHGWTYDASTDTFIPTEENKSGFYSYYGKTIAQIKAENNVKGITFCGPYLEQIFLDESYDDIVIGSYFARVYMPSYGHYLQAPF